MPRGNRTGPMGLGPMTGRGAGRCDRYYRAGFGAEESWWDDEDASWWLTAARIAGGDALVKTLSDAYSATAAVTKTQITAVKATITDKLKALADQGITEAKKLAAEAEARIKKAAEAQAYTGGFHGMLVVGAVGLAIWLFTRRR